MARLNRADALADIGRFTRGVVFLGGVVTWVVFVLAADWSTLTTPFAQLTISGLAGVLTKAALCLAMIAAWLAWAFWPTRAYRRWGWIGVCGFASWIVYAVLEGLDK